MLNDDLEIYGSCDLAKPIIPPRSRLYHLKPIGIGTPYVESLTSYIARLAEAHCLSPKLLLEREINSSNIQSSKRNNLFGIRQYSGEINGRGETASKLVNLLEKATLKENLRFLTLLSLSEIFPRKKLIKTKRFWCPFCCQDFVYRNKPVYEPLIWSVNAVVTCSKHKTPLESRCHHCDRELPPLSSNSRVGFCSKCGKWLGKSINKKTQKYQRYGKDEIQWNQYVNENIEKLISISHRSDKPISRDLLANSFNFYIAQLTQGNIAAFARMFGIPKNSAWMWTKGKSVPQIDTLLGICYRLNISVLDFLAIDRSLPIRYQPIDRNKIKSQNFERTNKSKTQINSEFIKKYLQDILIDGASTLSVTEIADILGYDRRVLTRKFPQLCQKISQTLKDFLEWKDRVLGVTTNLHPNANLDVRKAWLWVFSIQVVYGLRIHEAFAIANAFEEYKTKDGVTIPALNDSSNTDNILVLTDKTLIDTTTKTGYRLARPNIPPKYPNLIEILNIKSPSFPVNKPQNGSPKAVANFYNNRAWKKLKAWNAPTTETHAFRHLANVNGMQAGIPLEVRAQSMGHTPAMNDGTYKKRQSTQTTIDLLLNSNSNAIDFVTALAEAKKLVAKDESKREFTAQLLSIIYQKNQSDILELL